MGNREDSHTTDHSIPSKEESNPTSNLTFTEKELDSTLQQVTTFIDQLEKVGRENVEEAGRDFTEHIVLAHRLALAGVIAMLRRHEKTPVRVQFRESRTVNKSVSPCDFFCSRFLSLLRNHCKGTIRPSSSIVETRDGNSGCSCRC